MSKKEEIGHWAWFILAFIFGFLSIWGIGTSPIIKYPELTICLCIFSTLLFATLFFVEAHKI